MKDAVIGSAPAFAIVLVVEGPPPDPIAVACCLALMLLILAYGRWVIGDDGGA